MKKLTCLIIFLVSLLGHVHAQTNIGTITVTNGLTWDNNTETNLAGYHIYVGSSTETNLTKFVKVATVKTNVWRGDETKALNGPRRLYATAFNTEGLESAPSEVILLTFRAGVPVPPKNFQLYSVVYAAATNALPPLPK